VQLRAPAQQQNRQQRQAHINTAALAAAVVTMYSALAELAATKQMEGAAADTAAAKMPAAETLAAVAPLAAAVLLWDRQQHDSLAAAVAGSRSQHQQHKARADQAAHTASSLPASWLLDICLLAQHACPRGC
jgi:hypothetical protein